MNVRQLIEDLRGGVPGKCDWCQKEKDYLEPCSGGEWVCEDCLSKNELEK